jgi:hypothetical protein
MQAYWFKSTLVHPQKDGTFPILHKVWHQWPVIGLKSTLAHPQWVGTFQILHKVWRQWPVIGLKSTLVHPQWVGTFQILHKVWRQWPVIGLKNTLAHPPMGWNFPNSRWSVTSMTVIGESVVRPLFRTSFIRRVLQIRFHIWLFIGFSIWVILSVRMFNPRESVEVLYNKLLFLWNRFNTNAPRIFGNPAYSLVTRYIYF